MASKEDIKLNLERLRIENEIADSVERQTKSLSDWRKGQKELRENARQIKKLDQDILAIDEAINEAKKQGIKFTEEELKLINKQKAELEKRKAQLVSTNKELSNSVSLLKAMGNSALAAVKGMIPSLSDVIRTVFELDDKLRDTAASIGLSGAGFAAMQQSTEELRDASAEWNYGLNGGVQLMASFNEQTGRAVILSEEAGSKMFEVARATGMSAEEMGGLAGEMEAFGLGAGQAASMISNIQAMSEQMGVNAGKVIKKFQQNLGMLNRFNFRGGMMALAKMAAHSERFKISMESVASVADQVFRPEEAINAAATLQTMGGELAQLGDPFQLMYQARNAPEELMESLTKAARASAVFNKETGEFEMSAHEIDRLRESAKALGMDHQELVKTAKQAAKIDFLGQFLGDIPEEDRGLIEGMTQMTSKGAEITFYDKDKGLQTKLLKDLSHDEKMMITQRAKDEEERARQAMSIAKEWQSIQDSLMLVLVEVLQPVVDFLNSDSGKEWINGIKDLLLGLAQRIRSFFDGKGWDEIKAKFAEYKDMLITAFWIGVGTFVAIWVGAQFAAGAAFGLGMRSTAPVTPGTGGGTGGFMSGLGSGLGKAAQILAVGAALMLMAMALNTFADAMIKLKEVPAGLLIGVGAGLLVFVTALGLLGASGIGEIGVAIMIAIGLALLMIGGAVWLVAAGVSMVVDSFTNMFSIINSENIGAILLLGPALMLASLGIMALAASIVVMGLALMNPFGLLGLIGLAAAAISLKEAFGGVDAQGITEAVTAVNSVNKENIDALKSLSAWLAYAGNNIKIEFGEIHVDGAIDLSSGGTSVDSELLKDPIFLRELKRLVWEATDSDKKGGR